jgi:hypothetical protein
MARGDPCCLTMVRDNNLDSQADSSFIVSNIQNLLSLTTLIGLKVLLGVLRLYANISVPLRQKATTEFSWTMTPRHSASENY